MNSSLPAGMHDFDFFIGRWQARHRQLEQRLAGSRNWIEFFWDYRDSSAAGWRRQSG